MSSQKLLNVAAALAYLHSRQPAVVHGDLHPVWHQFLTLLLQV